MSTPLYLLNQAGLYLVDRLQYGEAETLYQQAVTLKERVLGPDHPATAATLNNLASTLNNLAILYRNQGNYKQAEPFYQRALGIRERTLGPDHPRTKNTRENYADLLQKMQQKNRSGNLKDKGQRKNDLRFLR